MSTPVTQAHDAEYQRYLTEAQAEVEAMLAQDTTPDPEPTSTREPSGPVLKVLVVAAIAGVVGVLVLMAWLMFKGRRPARSIA